MPDSLNTVSTSANVAVPPVARAGDSLAQVATPSLLLDLDAFDANVARMASAAAVRGVAVRPHAKAHKSVTIARAQMAAGAVGICCQKVTEAIPFVNAGIGNIHISNEFVGETRVALVVEMASRVALSVCVDDVRQVAPLGKAAQRAGVRIAVLPEVDVGQGRCGVDSTDAVAQLVDAIDHYEGLRFGGLQAYHGSAQHIDSWDRRRDTARLAADRASTYVRFLEARGIACPVVTGGGTGTAEFDIESGVYTEIQPGSYVFLDGHYGSLEWRDEWRFRHGLFLASTVMSTARAGIIVCDAGLKSVATDSGLPRFWSSQQAGKPHYRTASDEHGVLELGAPGEDSAPWLGEPILLVPGHCDPTVNLYDRYVAVRHGRVEGLWPIEARGLSQ
ncbi:DSD1 family PLP-dependent enzyme [Pandoraea communis]|uniref:Metal-activated pyridoxal protein n=1 Tax=Pandoraea communis TaxID=2508297 RepID=A0A5E4WIQ9_9BURK|nr:DSD1 family PLP-dependent enzyme [Pandoraea communis]MDM8358778.1 DSD1 family PLP-dependent enzyme [Pandoraea communis]VVE24351.1 metal-activated pyridoxal protein [Pandoraea communis]